MTTESELLARISAARGSTEPSDGPTETLEAVDVSEEMPVEESEEVVVVADAAEEVTDAEPDAEEEASIDGDETTDEADDEELYVEYKGRELSLKEVEEWEQGHLRLTDYKRKTQDLAEQRRQFESERESLNESKAKLDDMLAKLNVMTQEETLTADEIADMREYEPEKYIEYQEKMAKRKELLEQAKQVKPADVDVAAEREKLFSNNPEWLKDGKTTDAFANDTALINSYAREIGFSDQELAGLNQAHHMQAILDAAKYRQLKSKNASLEKKVRKAPVMTKPKAAAQSNLQTKIEQAQARLKQTGSADDAVKLRQLKRQLQG